MAKLTEEMVVARSRQSDLSTIKKLNCWGSDLTDVTIIRRMRGVEVLALSVNKISSLADFEDCEHLQELYLRKNNIRDLSELAYIQNLPRLRNLWLEENPCVETAGPNYRMIVLRALPNLTKLDNVDVTPDEVQEALRGGVRREEPVYEEPPQQSYKEVSPPPQQRQQPQQQDYRQQSPMRESLDNNPEECLSDPLERNSDPSSPMQRSPPNPGQFSPPELANTSPTARYQRPPGNGYSTYDVRMRSPGSDQDQFANSPSITNTNNNNGTGYRDRGIAPSISTQSMKEYYQSDYQKQQQAGGNYRHSQGDLTEWDEQSQSQQVARRNGQDREGPYGYRNGNGGNREDWEEERGERRRISSGHNESRRSGFNDGASVVSNAVLNHYASFHRRPVNRNSNLLSATLCLVKELDYNSLEVVEHAVRCRIDELSAD